MIRAGQLPEANRESGDWVFVDLGFAEQAKSCGLLVGDGVPKEVTFSKLTELLKEIVLADGGALNLLIEAPLSVAFTEDGNPTGRSIERLNSQTRYWYVGLGCCVLVAATYLLRAIHDLHPRRDIRLFEGFASFKPKRRPSTHSDDVRNLRAVVWDRSSDSGRIVSPEALRIDETHELKSAFWVAGMDFGIPAVVVIDRHLPKGIILDAS